MRTQQTEQKRIVANYDTIIEAITAKLKETNGRHHVIGLHDTDSEEIQHATWDVLTHGEKFEQERGVDYIEVEDIAVFDCNDDIYSATWESRIDIHRDIEVQGHHFEVALEAVF